MSWDALGIDTPRGRFCARSAGDAGHPLVVCLHGFLDDAATFDELLGWLGGHGFRAVAPYSRGHAPSPLEFAGRDREVCAELTADLLAICRTLSPHEPAHLVSHGAGSLVALEALACSPDSFARAAVLGSDRIDLTWRACKSLQRDGIADVESIWRRWSPDWVPRTEQVAVANRTLAVSWPGPLAFLAAQKHRRSKLSIRTPVCHFIGQRDATARLRGVEFTGTFREVVVPEASHFLQHEQTKLVSNAVVDWLTLPNGPASAAVNRQQRIPSCDSTIQFLTPR